MASPVRESGDGPLDQSDVAGGQRVSHAGETVGELAELVLLLHLRPPVVVPRAEGSSRVGQLPDGQDDAPAELTGQRQDEEQDESAGGGDDEEHVPLQIASGRRPLLGLDVNTLVQRGEHFFLDAVVPGELEVQLIVVAEIGFERRGELWVRGDRPQERVHRVPLRGEVRDQRLVRSVEPGLRLLQQRPGALVCREEGLGEDDAGVDELMGEAVLGGQDRSELAEEGGFARGLLGRLGQAVHQVADEDEADQPRRDGDRRHRGEPAVPASAEAPATGCRRGMDGQVDSSCGGSHPGIGRGGAVERPARRVVPTLIDPGPGGTRGRPARYTGVSPAMVTRSMTRLAGRKSFDTTCWVARLSQNATEPGRHRKRHCTSGIVAVA